MSDRDINAELEEARLLAAKAGEHHTPQFDGTTIVEENDSKWIAAELRALRLTIESQGEVQTRALVGIANHLSDLTRLPITVEAGQEEARIQPDLALHNRMLEKAARDAERSRILALIEEERRTTNYFDTPADHRAAKTHNRAIDDALAAIHEAGQ